MSKSRKCDLGPGFRGYQLFLLYSSSNPHKFRGCSFQCVKINILTQLTNLNPNLFWGLQHLETISSAEYLLPQRRPHIKLTYITINNSYLEFQKHSAYKTLLINQGNNMLPILKYTFKSLFLIILNNIFSMVNVICYMFIALSIIRH